MRGGVVSGLRTALNWAFTALLGATVAATCFVAVAAADYALDRIDRLADALIALAKEPRSETYNSGTLLKDISVTSNSPIEAGVSFSGEHGMPYFGYSKPEWAQLHQEIYRPRHD